MKCRRQFVRVESTTTQETNARGAERWLEDYQAKTALRERARARGGVCELAVYPEIGHLLTRNLVNQESDLTRPTNPGHSGCAKARG